MSYARETIIATTACPSCVAVVGERCRDRYGNPRAGIHEGRYGRWRDDGYPSAPSTAPQPPLAAGRKSTLHCPCPYCGVPGDEPCRRENGREREPHTSRRRAAADPAVSAWAPPPDWVRERTRGGRRTP